jgi:hypothetical protein
VKLRPTDGSPKSSPTQYRQLVDSLVYLTISRPDLRPWLFLRKSAFHGFTLQLFDSYIIYMTFLEPSFFSSSSSEELRATTDADWAGDPSDRCSTTSVFFLETLKTKGKAKSKRQLLVPVPKRSTVPWHTLLERLYGSVGDFLIAGFI